MNNDLDVKKTLKIYPENDLYVIERVNQFNHSFKRFFTSITGLSEGLQAYDQVISEYKVQIDKNLRGDKDVPDEYL